MCKYLLNLSHTDNKHAIFQRGPEFRVNQILWLNICGSKFYLNINFLLSFIEVDLEINEF